MFGDFDLLIWVIVGLTASVLIVRIIVLPFFKEFSKAGQKAKKLASEADQELSVKNIGKTAGSFAETEIEKYVKGLKLAHGQAMNLYKEQKEKGATPEVLEPLAKKIKQIEWILSHESEISMMNKALTGPIIGKFASKLLGGFL